MSKSQLKKQAQAAAAAASRDDAGDMPQMPVMPDKNTKWLWSRDGERRTFEFSKFDQLWPVYIDSTKTLQEGRRVAKEFCCQDPNIAEMSEICQSLKLNHVLEPYKMYPRLFLNHGRIRVEILASDGSPVNPTITSKVDLLKFMGQNIPKLNSRIAREAKTEEAKQLAAAAEQEQKLAAAGGGGGSAKKKKGKKK